MTQLICESISQMHQVGELIGQQLKAGDVVILSGPLGAGKTTLTQGIAQGLGVRGPITSPTFVISRIHPSLATGPSLIHVDAYRIDTLAEIEDLDLDSDLENAVLVAEWGAGKVDTLVEPSVLIDIQRTDTDTRILDIQGIQL